jgi:hypothetical protein
VKAKPGIFLLETILQWKEIGRNVRLSICLQNHNSLLSEESGSSSLASKNSEYMPT